LGNVPFCTKCDSNGTSGGRFPGRGDVVAACDDDTLEVGAFGKLQGPLHDVVAAQHEDDRPVVGADVDGDSSRSAKADDVQFRLGEQARRGGR
jgi:hypothetical protein